MYTPTFAGRDCRYITGSGLVALDGAAGVWGEEGGVNRKNKTEEEEEEEIEDAENCFRYPQERPKMKVFFIC